LTIEQHTNDLTASQPSSLLFSVRFGSCSGHGDQLSDQLSSANSYYPVDEIWMGQTGGVTVSCQLSLTSRFWWYCSEVVRSFV